MMGIAQKVASRRVVGSVSGPYRGRERCMSHDTGVTCFWVLLANQGLLDFSVLLLRHHLSRAIDFTSCIDGTQQVRCSLEPSVPSHHYRCICPAGLNSGLLQSLDGWNCLLLRLFIASYLVSQKMSLPSTLMSKSNLSCCQHRRSFLFPLGKAEEPGECYHYLLLPVRKSGGWVHSLAITCGRASSFNSLHSFSSYASVRSWLTCYLPCRQGDWTGLCGHAPTHDPPGFSTQKLLCSLCH